MYYQNYDDYMRDVFYFNQIPNPIQNPNMGCQNVGFNQSVNTIGQMNPMNQTINYNNMFPSIYRIVQPVVARVVTGNNYQYITEDNLNSMVDTVYNIVEGDVANNNESDSQTTQTVSAQTTRTQNANTNNSSNNVSNTRNCENQNATVLLKDLIKILLLKEIISRNNMRRVSNNMMWQPTYQNCCEARYMF
ncbi:MAG: hypothetical protein J6J60_00325 [Clostridia bacterium]|nr:hypothetical protein [Clostridia bacterium]